MTSLERVTAVLRREPVDRIPVDLWLTPEVLASLKKHTGESDELQMYRNLGVDKIVWIFPGYGQDAYDPNAGGGLDPWGVPTRMVQAGLATYQEYGTGPLADVMEIAELDAYPMWPVPEKFNFAAARRAAERARSFDFATIGPWISHFEIYCHLRGMENALMDVIAEPELLNATLDRIESIQTRMLELFFAQVGDLIDCVFLSDDMGTQDSQLISVAAWQEFFQPRVQRWTDLIHAHGKKVFYHTDGAARDFVPHLIASGVDVLNPIQHVCPGMERAGLKRDFGSQVVFHGGVENQRVLPFGAPDDVRAEVRACLETLGDGGGYIPCSCHNIQAGTPPENVLALIDAVHSA